MKKIPFTKMHGCGNDYIYVNAIEHPIADPSACAARWSDVLCMSPPCGSHSHTHSSNATPCARSTAVAGVSLTWRRLAMVFWWRHTKRTHDSV